MTSFGVRVLPTLIVVLSAVPVPALAQAPGVDRAGCKESPLMLRVPGCSIVECVSKAPGMFEVVINKAGEMKSLEGAGELLKLVCPAAITQIQLHLGIEAALRKSGYTIAFSGRHVGHVRPAVTAQRGAQWISVQTGDVNEFPAYEQTTVLVREMAQQMSASAQAMSDAIAASGRLDAYSITFAPGQAAISPASDAFLIDLLAVLAANPDWRLRIEGHTDNAGDQAANLNLSAARAAAVAAWLTGRGVAAGRLSPVGLGGTQPVAENSTEDGRARNRRVVLIKQ